MTVSFNSDPGQVVFFFFKLKAGRLSLCHRTVASGPKAVEAQKQEDAPPGFFFLSTCIFCYFAEKQTTPDLLGLKQQMCIVS